MNTCPNCGYCPHCGRSAQPHFTPYIQPSPTWNPTYTPYGWPTIVVSGGANGSLPKPNETIVYSVSAGSMSENQS